MMQNILQLFAHGCSKWVACCGCGDVGGWEAPMISACIWQASIGLYQRQNKAKSSRLNREY